MNYEKYKYARNAAWKILIDNNINSLPIKISSICVNLGIKIIPYSKAKNIDITIDYSCDGYTKMVNNKPYIFYNDNCSSQRSRFTIAHELGHIVLGHIKNGERTKINREPSDNDDPLENQANIFASRILAPSCVLWALKINNAKDIAKICDISIQSATFRLKRLNILYNREQDFIAKYGKSCFLISAEENKVLNQFMPFIDQFR